jgi:hypothetical protein
MGERCQSYLHTIDQHCVTLFCVTQETVTLATAGRVNEGGYIRVERKEKWVRVDKECVMVM